MDRRGRAGCFREGAAATRFAAVGHGERDHHGHYSGVTPHYNERALAIFLDNLRRYKAGEPLRNMVDKTLGY